MIKARNIDKCMLLMITLFAATLVSAQMDSDVLRERMLSSVVKITSCGRTFMGTIISERGTVLTVADAVESCTESEITVVDRYSKARAIRSVDKSRDLSISGLAILELEGFSGAQPLAFSLSQLKELQTVISLGYLGRVDNAMINGSLSRVDNDDVFANFTVGEGSRGAPIVDEYGNLIGLVGFVDSSDELVTVIPAPVIKRLIDKRSYIQLRFAEPSVAEQVSGPLSTSILGLQEQIEKCSQNNKQLLEQIVGMNRRHSTYRDSVQTAFTQLTAQMDTERDRLTVERGKLATERERHDAEVRNARALFDSAVFVQQELQRVRNELVRRSTELSVLRSDVQQYGNKRDELQLKTLDLEGNVRRLEQREDEMSKITYLPRFRFTARSHLLYQGLREGPYASKFYMGRGEIDFGVRTGIANRNDVGDAYGVYLAGILSERSVTTLPSTHRSYDWGGFAEFNNAVRLLFGVGASNDVTVPNLRRYMIGSVSLKFSGNVQGAWGVSMQIIKPQDSPTYNVGGGIWFSFGSNFLQL